MGPRYVVIKKVEHCDLVFHNENIFFAAALPVEEVFDTTCGCETFAGGFVGYLSENEQLWFNNLSNGVINGSNLASFCVDRFGTDRMANFKKEEIDRRLRQFRELTQFDIELK